MGIPVDQKENTPDLLTIRLGAAQTLQVAGKWKESLDAYTKALQEFGQDSRIFNGRGVINRLLRNPAAAIADFTQARDLAHTTSSPEEELVAVIGLVDAYRTANRNPNFNPWSNVRSEDLQQRLYEQAQTHMTEAETLMTSMPGPSLAKVHAFTNFGLLYNDIGNLPKALKAYALSVTSARDLVTSKPSDINCQNRLARALTAQGETQEGSGDLNSALTSLSESLDLQIELGDLRGIGNAKVSKGRVLGKMGNINLAKALLLQAQSAAMKDSKIIDTEVYYNTVKELAKLQNLPIQS